MKRTIITENLVDFVVSQIQAAHSSIRLSVHRLTEVRVLDALAERSKQQVRVELLLSNTPGNWLHASYFNQMTASGSKVYLINRKAVHTEHEQDYCLIDSRLYLTRACRWTNPTGMHETIEVSELEDEADLSIMQAYEKQFTDALNSYKVTEGAHPGQFGIAGDTATLMLRKRAEFFYESAVAYRKLDRISDALDSINEGILALPAPDAEFQLLRHTLLLESKLFVEATECMFEYFTLADKKDADALHLVKLTYRDYKSKIREKGIYTAELIGEINQLTCEQLSLFDALNIRPHFFRRDELNLYPF